MSINRPIHPDFQALLDDKSQEIEELFSDLRQFILDQYPDSNELLYHTHALTAVFSISEKLGDAFCHIPIYSEHLNLGFNKGTLLSDDQNLLHGTGKLIRHIPIRTPDDYRKPAVEQLVKSAIRLALDNMNKPSKSAAKTISKIKKK